MLYFLNSPKIVFIKLCLSVFIFLGVAGCQSLDTDANYNRPITKEQVAKVKGGMNVVEVQRILGSPSINDTFRPQTLIYLFIIDNKPHQIIVSLTNNKIVEKVDILQSEPKY